LAAQASTELKYFFISVLTADLYALLRSRLRSAIWARLRADFVFATVIPKKTINYVHTLLGLINIALILLMLQFLTKNFFMG
jgi:hypothetical protein